MNRERYPSTILVVDDDPKVGEILTKIFEKANHNVLTALNAEEAYAAVTQHLPDLILLDILLPGSDGFEIAARLKEDEETRGIPLIFLSVKSGTEDKVRAFQLGAVDYITKPIELEVAEARINTHLTLCGLQRRIEKKNRQLQQEIDGHKRTEYALKESEAHYHRLVEFNPGPVVVHSEGKIVYVNKAGMKLIGAAEPGDILGKPILDCVHPDYRDIVVKRVHQAQEEGREISTLEEKFLRLDGEIIDVEVTGIPITYKGKPATQLIVYDITERKRAEEELTETHQLLETVLSSTHMLVAYLDPEFNFVWVNRAYAEADDKVPADFPGKNHFDCYPNPENKKIFRRVVETGQSHFAYAKGFEYTEYPERGVSYWDWSLNPTKDQKGKVTGLVLTLADITKRIEAEEQVKASLKEKEVLLKEVHHRVKNNLQVINSLLSLQARRIKEESIASVFEEIKNRIYSIALVHERLYDSRNLANINFAEYTRILISHLRKTFPANLTDVRLEIDDDEVSLQVGKAIPCALIINELVTNALKYAFPGERRGIITVTFKTTGDNKVTLVVADDGVGLPDDFNIDTPKALGMQIINALVKQLHGSLRVDTKGGTAFTITFQAPLN